MSPHHRSSRGQRVVFPGPGKVELEPFDLPGVEAGQVRLRSEYSLISTGTETTALKGTFEPGSHWDDYVQYPFLPGYTATAVVEETGADVTGLVPGDRIMARISHASHAVVDAAECFPVPDAIASDLAPWATLAQVAYVGAEAAEHRLRDGVLVIGAGPIGQMSVRWAVAAGAETVIVADIAPQRLELALRGGATAVVEGDPGERADEIVAAGFGEAPRVVIDTTGRPDMLPKALGLVRDHGTVVLLGDPGAPSEQHLTKDVITRGLRIRGAHGPLRLDVEAETYRSFFGLITTGRIRADGLNTHHFAPEDCAAAYRLVTTERGTTMGVIFDWVG
ncbi:zinc-binding dehydrogenase [Jiangella sp. DSM 45060]|uniref:zinc-dependent alcohol dehydrogenase n=1 Tax=Jiangella sp. DSM 45060 TaxID=1798224 RepID=UPI000879577B|nr:zinc-binding alcohol dehydrogenase [Jiangella sp. DSM 45060]SDT11858.1 2-desacetyl-2-hydroxyethyl bacteriochlorophyllide A dehydrogenase [Jiangella sp. DSM 45060]